MRRESGGGEVLPCRARRRGAPVPGGAGASAAAAVGRDLSGYLRHAKTPNLHLLQEAEAVTHAAVNTLAERGAAVIAAGWR